MARRTRLVATGCVRTNSLLPHIMQQKYCDQGWSVVGVEDHTADLAGAQLLRLRREAEEGVDLPVGEQLHRRCASGSVTQSMSLCGSSPTWAAMIAR